MITFSRLFLTLYVRKHTMCVSELRLKIFHKIEFYGSVSNIMRVSRYNGETHFVDGWPAVFMLDAKSLDVWVSK